MDHPFRTAVFGGFQREDVLNYLAEQARQSQQQREELERRLDEQKREAESAVRQAEALSGQLEQQRAECGQLREEREALTGQLEQANRDLSASRTQCSQAGRELEELRKERDELQARLDALTPGAQAYEQLKDRTAGVELEAHRRAQAIQEQAREEADRLHRQVEQWLQGVERTYDGLRTQVETTAAHAARELRQANDHLERACAQMEEQEEALAALRRAYGAGEGAPKVEPPMPIPEGE